MVDAATINGPLARTGAGFGSPPALAAGVLAGLAVSTTHRIEDVEAIWRGLEARGIESPGQSYDFIRLWIEKLQVAEANRLFVVASLDGAPVALLPLHRTHAAGVRVYGWFPGDHVGCGAPLLDAPRFADLSAGERTQFWRQVMAAVPGADLIHLRNVPEAAQGLERPFAELGRGLPTETLFRAAFSSWDEANTTQRSKSRRKHDRQQGERLEALGQVTFEEMDGSSDAAAPVLAEMFRQRARRFEVMGVADPFAAPDIAAFYAATVGPGTAVKVRLHLLRLDGEIVAVRYNIAYGDRLFCLISSMSDDPRIQGGSPGKQCLLRVMQTMFEAGYRVFDMGNGFTDEKRHWCNVQIGLSSHYIPLTPLGRLALDLDALWRSTKARIKANPRLLALAKAVRLRLRGQSAAPAPVAAEAETE